MNKNIIKLAEQAMESIPDDCPSIEHGLAIFNKKFAELIVRECSAVALNIGCGDIEDELLKHFGVE